MLTSLLMELTAKVGGHNILPVFQKLSVSGMAQKHKQSIKADVEIFEVLNREKEEEILAMKKELMEQLEAEKIDVVHRPHVVPETLPKPREEREDITEDEVPDIATAHVEPPEDETEEQPEADEEPQGKHSRHHEQKQKDDEFDVGYRR